MDYGHEEVAVKWGRGDPRRYNTQSKEFLLDPDTGRVSGVRTSLVEWTKDPETGRWKLNEVPDSEKVYPCQLVLLAMGFLGPEQYVVKDAALETDNRYWVHIQNNMWGGWYFCALAICFCPKDKCSPYFDMIIATRRHQYSQ